MPEKLKLPNLFAFSRSHQWKEFKQNLQGLRFWRTQLTMLVGVSLNSLVVNAIVIPHNFFAGGLTGISLGIYYLNNSLGLGWIYFILNIPLFVLAWKKLNLSFIVHSISGMTMASIMLQATKSVHWEVPDPFVATILAGSLCGAGVGFYFRFGGSSGGMDILAAYLRKSYSIPLGVTFNMANLCILTFAFIFNDLMTTFYSGVFIFCSSWMAEKMISGFSQRSAVTIITDAPHLIAAEISKRLDRGVTFLHASGGYDKAEKEVIYTVINFTEAGRLKELIYEVDENAFITILNTTAVIGSKFLTWEDEGYTYKKHQVMLQQIEQEKHDLEA
ncbi:MAG: YitT family protein [SAR324 cluster bacterium]|nr:YitT family protein [SAR324 cluster bacterium]